MTDAQSGRGISGWQATALALAAVVSSGATGRGLGTALGVLAFAPVVYALIRLRRRSPDADTTSDLVAAVLGPRAGTTVDVLQVVGYAVFAAALASGFGLITVFSLVQDPQQADVWLAILLGLAATVVAAIAAFALPTRIVTTVVGILVAISVLAIFYLSLAVIAKTLSDPNPPSILAPSVGGWMPETLIVVLAALSVGLVGFELGTTHLRRDMGAGRPMILSIAIGAVVAMTAWGATQVGNPGSTDASGADLSLIAISLFGGAAQTATTLAAFAAAIAGLLALMLAIVRLTGRAGGTLPSEAVLGSTVVAIGLLVVAISNDWLALQTTVHLVGALPLLVVYALANEANSRLDDGTVGWWLRFVVPCVLLAIALLAVFATVGQYLPTPG